MTSDTRASSSGTSPLTADATVELLNRLRTGDKSALSPLLEQCLPALRRWARGRMPPSTFGVAQTPELVRDAVITALGRLDAFAARHQAALQAYLRTAVMSRIREDSARGDRWSTDTAADALDPID